MAETRAGWAKYCIRQVPPSSADVRGHPRHVWGEDGRWKMGNYEEKQNEIGLNGRNQGGVGKYCFRQLPRKSVDIRGMRGRKMEDVANYEEKQRKLA